MSKLLKEFYVAYWNWLNCGAPDEEPFQRHIGLCTNLEWWCTNNNHPNEDLVPELIKQFRSAGLSMGYPFGVLEYKKDMKNETQHLNPLRIKWVEEHCK